MPAGHKPRHSTMRPGNAVAPAPEVGVVDAKIARPRQAIDQAATDRIWDEREHDRHGAGCFVDRGPTMRAKTSETLDCQLITSGFYFSLLCATLALLRGIPATLVCPV